MSDIFESARNLQRDLPLEIMAHRLAAEYHRRRHMVLGGLSTVLTAVVGTAIFTAMVNQLGLAGEGEIRNPFRHGGVNWVYAIIVVLSLTAPVLSALHTFLHDAEDTARHTASVEGYSSVLWRLTRFLAKYDGANHPPEKTDEALEAFEEITQEHATVEGKSLTLNETAYTKAKAVLEARNKSATR